MSARLPAGRIGSSLARVGDVVLDASVDRQMCPLNLAPTASTAVAMAIGDALAAVWFERRSLSWQDFALNLPAGFLGEHLTLTAADLIVPVTRLAPLRSSSPLAEVIVQLSADGFGACWVADEAGRDRIDGLITDEDLRRALQEHEPQQWGQRNAADLMTDDPITVQDDILAIAALERTERSRRKAISVLPVVDRNKRMLGLLRLHDLVQAGLMRGGS